MPNIIADMDLLLQFLRKNYRHVEIRRGERVDIYAYRRRGRYHAIFEHNSDEGSNGRVHYDKSVLITDNPFHHRHVHIALWSMKHPEIREFFEMYEKFLYTTKTIKAKK